MTAEDLTDSELLVLGHIKRTCDTNDLRMPCTLEVISSHLSPDVDTAGVVASLVDRGFVRETGIAQFQVTPAGKDVLLRHLSAPADDA
jgi:hypothetical protein